ncbi:MAG: transcriptional regulator [Alphaproteobacteria bacterium]|uniref:winged helix-turn-helix domain-containing protein n=1 Tax=Maricaulis alexandrii TaxID=2570354 RepID=UPI001107FC42|nr:transcriptional regulator [Maricaulis alexandrii]MCR9266553.1 transcriptional regulator [Alphaproteobacteria bacterium]
MSDPEFDASRIDETIHGRLRLGIMAFLSALDSATFAEIKQKTGSSDGNLSVHLRKLEEAGYVAIEKRFVDRKPQTRAALTEAGRQAWLAYLDQLRQLIGDQTST